MSVKDFMEEDHPTMFVSHDGKIGEVRGVTFIRLHVYVRECPRWIPSKAWYWLADRITYTISETYNPYEEE